MHHFLEHFRDNSKHLDTEQCIFCADLLYETVLICESKKIEDLSVSSKMLSLHLYLNVIPIEKQFQITLYKERVNELIKELETKNIPESVRESILTYQKLLDHEFKKH